MHTKDGAVLTTESLWRRAAKNTGLYALCAAMRTMRGDANNAKSSDANNTAAMRTMPGNWRSEETTVVLFWHSRPSGFTVLEMNTNN